ncbi:MAG: helix-turn-helix domain-containing protein [Candidatus Zhuqueibacterota bacterium]
MKTDENKDYMNEFDYALSEIKRLIEKEEKPFLSIVEASEYLGISRNTLYGYTSKGILQYYKLQGRKIYFKREDLNNFVLNEKNYNTNL